MHPDEAMVASAAESTAVILRDPPHFHVDRTLNIQTLTTSSNLRPSSGSTQRSFLTTSVRSLDALSGVPEHSYAEKPCNRTSPLNMGYPQVFLTA